MRRRSAEANGSGNARVCRWLWLLPVSLALVVRVVHVGEVAGGPFPHLQAWTQSDMQFFDRWARSIDAGDLWTHAPMRPYHVWHDTVAREAYVAAGEQPSTFDSAIGRSMWGAWLGDHRLYQDPGYPYALAALYAVFGNAVPVVWSVQTMLALGCVLLVFSLARRLYGLQAAVLAACTAALYGPLVFYEPVLLRCVSISVLSLLALRLAIAALDSARLSLWLSAGAAAGIAYLFKSTALLPAVIVVVAGIWVHRCSYTSAFGFVLVFLLGWSLTTLPLVVRNLHEGVPPWSGAAAGVVSFVRHNHAEFEPGHGSGASPLVADIMRESGGRAWPALPATVSSFSTPFGWPWLLARKFLAFWTPYEIPNNTNYAYWKLLAPWTAALTIGFVWIVLAAAAGLSLGLREDPGRVLLVATVAAAILVCVLFFNLSRFRLPIACLMMPLAGAGIAEIGRGVRHRRAGSVVRTTTAICVAGALVAVASTAGQPSIRVADYGVANKVAIHLAALAERERHPGEALTIVTKQLTTEPVALSRIERGGGSARVDLAAARTAGSFAELHAVAAGLYAREGLAVSSQHHRQRAALYERIDRQARDREARRLR